MKRNSYLRAVFGLLSFLALPELSLAQQVRLGLETGVSKISSDFDTPQRGWQEPQSRRVLNGMMLLDIPLQKQFSLQPGLRFRRFGTSVNYKSLIVGGDVVESTPGMFKTTQSLLSMPLRLKYKLDAVYVLSGPELAYLLSASVFNRQQYEGIGVLEHEGNLVEEFNRLNLAFNIGFGYEFKFDDSILYIQALYSRGLTNTSKAFTNSTFVPWTWRSHELNLSLGYLF